MRLRFWRKPKFVPEPEYYMVTEFDFVADALLGEGTVQFQDLRLVEARVYPRKIERR